MYGRAYLSQFWLNCIEKDCFLNIVVNYIIGFETGTKKKGLRGNFDPDKARCTPSLNVSLFFKETLVKMYTQCQEVKFFSKVRA